MIGAVSLHLQEIKSGKITSKKEFLSVDDHLYSGNLCIGRFYMDFFKRIQCSM